MYQSREARLLAPAVGALLVDLRRDGEDVVAASGSSVAQRVGVERHVVVHQVRPVVPGARDPALDRADEAERQVVVHQLDFRELRFQVVIGRGRRAVGDDDHLVRLVDTGERVAQRGQRLGQHGGRVALGNDDRNALSPGRHCAAPRARA